MTLIRNLTPAPYDLAPGVILPANGEVETDQIPAWLVETLKLTTGVEVVEVVPDDEIEQWRTLYTEATGKKPHHLWKIPRLMAEIENAG